MMQRIFFFFIGLIIGLILGQSGDEQDVQRLPAASRPAAAPPPRVTKPEPAAIPATADSLTDIKGIGPSFAQALNAAGITSFSQMAQMSAEELASKVPRATVERVQREDWVGQAKRYLNEADRKNE